MEDATFTSLTAKKKHLGDIRKFLKDTQD